MKGDDYDRKIFEQMYDKKIEQMYVLGRKNYSTGGTKCQEKNAKNLKKFTIPTSVTIA